MLPELAAFAPEFVLISAGFDAHRLDPLAGMRLSARADADMRAPRHEHAARSAQGRLVSVLEGGYHLSALASCREKPLAARTPRARP